MVYGSMLQLATQIDILLGMRFLMFVIPFLITIMMFSKSCHPKGNTLMSQKIVFIFGVQSVEG